MYLDSKNLSYSERNIEDDREAQQELIDHGLYSVPVIKLDEEYIVGFNPMALKRKGI